MECCDFKFVKAKNLKERLAPQKMFYAVFMITDDCNFQCTYCFEKKKKRYLTKEQATTFIDKMFDFKDYKDYWGSYYQEGDDIETIQFMLFGGEPFLNVELMEYIMDYFISKCNEDLTKYQHRLDTFRATIITNGSLINTEQSIKFLDKYHERLELSITLEGCKSFHDSCRFFKGTKTGTYDLVKKNFLWYKERYGNVGSKVTISPNNVDKMYDCYLALKDLGMKSIHMTFQADTDKWNEEHEKIANEQFKLIMEDLLKNPDIHYSQFDIDTYDRSFIRLGCNVGRSAITLDCDGYFYPCYQFTELVQTSKKAKSARLGHVDEGITNNQFCNTLWSWGDKVRYDTYECKTCTEPSQCTSCVGNNYKYSDDLSISKKWNCGMLKVQAKYALIYNYLKEKSL